MAVALNCLNWREKAKIGGFLHSSKLYLLKATAMLNFSSVTLFSSVPFSYGLKRCHNYPSSPHFMFYLVIPYIYFVLLHRNINLERCVWGSFSGTTTDMCYRNNCITLFFLSNKIIEFCTFHGEMFLVGNDYLKKSMNIEGRQRPNVGTYRLCSH